MDRRKAEIHEQYGSLKQECETTVELLKKLLEVCSNQLETIDKLDSNSFRRYSKFFLAVMQFHSLSKQKILECNFDLEEFLAEQYIPEPESLEIKSKQDKKEPSLHFEAAQRNNHESDNLSFKKAQETKFLCIDIDENETKQYSNNSNKLINNEVYASLDNLNDSFATCDFFSTSSSIEDKIKNEQDNNSNFKSKQKFLPKDCSEVPKPSTTSEVLNSLPQMTIEEKCTKTLFQDSKISTPSFQPEKSKNQSTTIEKKCSENIHEKTIVNVNPLQQSDDTINHSKVELISNVLTSRVTHSEKCNDNQILQNAGNVTKLTVEQINEESLPKSKVINVSDRISPKVGDTCMIGYVESPREFYIQVADENAYLIDNLPNELSTLHHNSPFIHSSKTNSMKTFGNFYAAFIEDCWYRVEVINWRLSDENERCVEIHLIDYGHKYDFNYDNLYPLTEALCKIPKMAQRCHLGYVCLL
ncbi:hypothetical protein ILUMI_02775 [Ignelater luminosus]|uniref:Tudor domain-containing protein n=1 Tax=Ignelater luminosus TaxID=2038154 RepID=A0A8K0DHQ0_IGNLU|nr:hypothetical protein ILUMI_02775 [Ignelater luminosus]